MAPRLFLVGGLSLLPPPTGLSSTLLSTSLGRREVWEERRGGLGWGKGEFPQLCGTREDFTG